VAAILAALGAHGVVILPNGVALASDCHALSLIFRKSLVHDFETKLFSRGRQQSIFPNVAAVANI
jgi:hypothetical protein